MAKTKALISCAVTAQLICVFVFAYAKSQFSHNEAHFLPHLALAPGMFAFIPSLSVMSNISSLPSDRQVTSREGIAGFQARSNSVDPALPFSRTDRNGAKLPVT